VAGVVENNVIHTQQGRILHEQGGRETKIPDLSFVLGSESKLANAM
jgi:hypothetical protein